jgi:C1A family cysteine protease
MNSRLKTLAVAAVASTLLSGLACAEGPDSKPDPVLAALYQSREAKASPDIQEKLKTLRKRIKDEKLTFTVGYTEPMDRPLSQLCGTVPSPKRSTRAPLNRLGPPAADEGGVQKVALIEIESFSWQNLGKVTPVRDQGLCADCWAFSTVAMLESAYLIEEKKDYDLSEQDVLSCTGPDIFGQANNCTSGHLNDALLRMKLNGLTSEKELPYTATDSACQNNVVRSYGVAEFGDVSQNDNPSVAELKEAIKKGPVAAGVFADAAFQSYTGGVFNDHQSGAPNHAVLIVGWWTIEGHTIWLVKNSWGKNWGLSGYMLIVAGSNAIGSEAVWVKAKPKDSGWPAGTPRPGVSPTPTPSSYPAGSPHPGVSPTPTR